MDELILACAIFSKIINQECRDDNDPENFEIGVKSKTVKIDQDSLRLIDALGLDQQAISQMYINIKKIIDDPIRIHAIWKTVQRQSNSGGTTNGEK